MISLFTVLWSLQEANRACPRGRGQDCQKKKILHQFACRHSLFESQLPDGNIPSKFSSAQKSHSQFMIIESSVTVMTGISHRRGNNPRRTQRISIASTIFCSPLTLLAIFIGDFGEQPQRIDAHHASRHSPESPTFPGVCLRTSQVR
jgi:hypothetical protein